MSQKGKIPKAISGVLLLFFLSISDWPAVLFRENLTLLVFIGLTSFLLIFLFNREAKTHKAALLVIIPLAAIQIKSTNIIQVFSPNPADIDLQTTRMNYYAPSQARLGYYLEKQPLTVFYYQIEENLFNALDLNLFFPNYLNFAALPFLLVGFYKIFEGKKSLYKYLLITSFVCLGITGVNGDYGPIIVLPFFILSIYFGLNAVADTLFKGNK